MLLLKLSEFNLKQRIFMIKHRLDIYNIMIYSQSKKTAICLKSECTSCNFKENINNYF